MGATSGRATCETAYQDSRRFVQDENVNPLKKVKVTFFNTNKGRGLFDNEFGFNLKVGVVFR